LDWLKLPAAISADITSSAAGKKRGFCRLRFASGGGHQAAACRAHDDTTVSITAPPRQ
jgi:hypothetical protein